MQQRAQQAREQPRKQNAGARPAAPSIRRKLHCWHRRACERRRLLPPRAGHPLRPLRPAGIGLVTHRPSPCADGQWRRRARDRGAREPSKHLGRARRALPAGRDAQLGPAAPTLPPSDRAQPPWWVGHAASTSATNTSTSPETAQAHVASASHLVHRPDIPGTQARAQHTAPASASETPTVPQQPTRHWPRMPVGVRRRHPCQAVALPSLSATAPSSMRPTGGGHPGACPAAL